MRLRKITIIFLFIFVVVSFYYLSGEAGQKRQKTEAVAEEEVYIPQEIKTIMEQGVAARQPRLDIPFEIVRFLYVPAQQNVHAVFLFKIKNADLVFELPLIETEEKKAELEVQTEVSQIIQTNFKIFAQFFENKNGTVGQMVRESYVPASFQEESSAHQPEKDNVYSLGYPLPPGDYLMALAVTSPDLSKVGLQLLEFSLPDFLSFQDKLGLTPVFFIESFEQHEKPEIITKVHKNSFVYSTLEIVPKVKNIFSPNELVDIFYFVYGCKPKTGTNQYDIAIKYRVLKGEEPVMLYKESVFPFPLISHPLPFLKKDDQPPEPGSYILEINITDNVSGHSLDQNIAFEIK